jgi:hypothetical protein
MKFVVSFQVDAEFHDDCAFLGLYPFTAEQREEMIRNAIAIATKNALSRPNAFIDHPLSDNSFINLHTDISVSKAPETYDFVVYMEVQGKVSDHLYYATTGIVVNAVSEEEAREKALELGGDPKTIWRGRSGAPGDWKPEWKSILTIVSVGEADKK